jgi:hypothetical protein
MSDRNGRMPKGRTTGDAIMTIAGWGFFIYFIAPGLGLGIAIALSMWATGYSAMSPWGIGLNVAAALIYFISRIFLKKRKLEVKELRGGLIMLITGLILLPFQIGFIRSIESMAGDTPVMDRGDLLSNMQNMTGELLTMIASYGSCATAVISILVTSLTVLDILSENTRK